MSTEARGGSLHVSWDEYHCLIERLAVVVHESGYAFDAILCLARGGMRVGDVLSRVFQAPLAILATSSYRGAGRTVPGALDIAEYITSTGGPLEGRILLVDDLVDSGNTLARVREHLATRFPAIREIRTAVVWYKEGSTTAPDFHVVRVAGNPWIHQPFERYDGLRPADLAQECVGDRKRSG